MGSGNKKSILWFFDTKVTFLNINIGEVLRSRFLFFTFTELFFKHGVKIFNDQDQGRTFLDVSGVLMSSAFKIKVTLLKIWLYFFEDFGWLFKIDHTFQDHPKTFDRNCLFSKDQPLQKQKSW